VPVVVVVIGTIGAVHHDPSYSARSQQGLVDGQVAQVGEQPRPFLVVQRLLEVVLGVIQGLQCQGRVLRITSERVGGK
jgi:hypothetical protein